MSMLTNKEPVFVTGGTGFIGRHLVRELVRQGYAVRCLVRKSSHTQPLEELGVTLIYGDVTDANALTMGMRGCHTLYHLANLYAMWHPHPQDFERVNVEGTRTVMQAALDCDVQKVVYLSTVAVFGKPARSPFTEEDPPGRQFFSRYAASKARAEEIAWQFHHQNSLPLVVLYPGIVLGPGDDKPSGQYIQDILLWRVPTPIYRKSVNTYVAVQDVVTAAILAAQNAHTNGKRYLIGNQRINGLEYARLICAVSGAPMPPLRLPDWMVNLVGAVLGWLCDRIKLPPPWGLSPDACRTLQNGFSFDGSRAASELGFTYSPVRVALQAACRGYKKPFWVRKTG
ncbi:MAG: hypothetical protein CVU39_20275 [Chloroflexi bacterium HGW-Chloroflexi-10]|nr:MAG: hypothetical protein CVU39_20275 [Chloroflexi bacterium HGW-Chloroflexi-10]